MTTMTTLCYIARGSQWLMLHRVKKAHDLNEGKWIGIGGKFEPGESPEDCLLREVREETGLRLTSYRFRGIVTFVSDNVTEYMHLFTADGFTGTLCPCDEGELEWLDRAEVYRKTLWAGDRIFLRLLEADAPFFSLKLRYNGDALAEAVLNGQPIVCGAESVEAPAPAAGNEPVANPGLVRKTAEIPGDQGAKNRDPANDFA